MNGATTAPRHVTSPVVSVADNDNAISRTLAIRAQHKRALIALEAAKSRLGSGERAVLELRSARHG